MSRPYTIAEAAERLRKTPRWVMEWLRAHPTDEHGPITRLSDATRYYTTAISNALNSLCEESLNAAHAQGAAPR
jgi:hypothetical protein